MKTKHFQILIIFTAITFFCSVSVFAYPLSQTGTLQEASGTSIQVPSFNFDISGPFQSFIKGMSTFSLGNVGQWTPQSAWQGFDNWLYGITGFHISGFLTAITGVLVWVLNLAKSIIDWLLSFLHSN